MSFARRSDWTLAGFLEWEAQQDLRYEFDGVNAVAMAGGTAALDRIALNLAAALISRLRGTPCQPHGSHLKIEVMGHARYPDGYITCTPQEPGATIVTNPVVIFEILSDTSARRDRVEKLREYCATASVTHYVMLEQGEIAATMLTRRGEDWITTSHGPNDMLVFPNINLTMPLRELYDDVTFTDAEKIK